MDLASLPTFVACSVDDCGRPVNARGLCAGHYAKWWRHGDTDQRKQSPLEERFWAKVAVVDDPNGCWLWTAGTNRAGYGRINGGRRGDGVLLAHRVSWELAHGPIPDDLRVLHQCDTPPCVNPAHLFLGTQADNVADMCAKGRHGRAKR